MKVVVLKAGLVNQDYRKKQEMRLIFKYGTIGPSGLNQDSRDSLSFLLTRASARAIQFMWHSHEYATRHVS